MKEYFRSNELARRYRIYRPQVQSQVLQDLATSAQHPTFPRALDVGCGTGHSTLPLAAIAQEVYACDPSRAMLREAQGHGTDVPLVRSRAEQLPFDKSCIDLITVSLAFHWLDQVRFLEEAGRILRPGGELWVYHFSFPGHLRGDDSFYDWFRDSYLVRFPTPARNREPLSAFLGSNDLGLTLAREQRFEYDIVLSADALRCYLTTQSNIDAALIAGQELDQVDEWLSSGLAPFFEGDTKQHFKYVGRAEVAVARSSPFCLTDRERER